MRVALKPHADTPAEAICQIEVEIGRPDPGKLTLHYLVRGIIHQILLPAPAAATRTDGLWEHTCFEAFLRPQSRSGYREFNFSPSTQWAAYTFTGYRQGRRDAVIEPPRIEADAGPEHYELRVALGSLHVEPVRLGLSVVIEELSGRKSYWALAHPPGKADFHHSDCFAIQLPSAD